MSGDGTFEGGLYPSAYIVSDELSINRQRRHYFRLGSELLLAFFVALVGFFAPFCSFLHWVQIGLLVLLLFVAIWGCVCKFEDEWYNARALAESIKTITWRYTMKSEPFEKEDADQLFMDRLGELMGSSSIKDLLVVPEEGFVSITEKMKATRLEPEKKRVEIYSDRRIKDQMRWYSKKASSMRGHMKAWSAVVAVSACIALLLGLIALVAAEEPRLPVEAFVVAVTSASAWRSGKRYGDLASAYTLTAQEISVLYERFSIEVLNSGMSVAVADAEQAFSREHGRWLSRIDV